VTRVLHRKLAKLGWNVLHEGVSTMRNDHRVYHVCRACYRRFAGCVAWDGHHLFGRTRCVLPRWLNAVCDRSLPIAGWR
jgi:hypothetical protein